MKDAGSMENSATPDTDMPTLPISEGGSLFFFFFLNIFVHFNTQIW